MSLKMDLAEPGAISVGQSGVEIGKANGRPIETETESELKAK